MSKKNVSIKINIPADYLITSNLFNEFVAVEATVINRNDQYLVKIDTMTFSGCIAFAIKSECISRLLDLVEQMAIIEAKGMDQDFERDQIFYHEIAEHGI